MLTTESLHHYWHTLTGPGGDLRLFMPQFVLCLTIVLILLLRTFSDHINAKPFAFIGTVIGLLFALWNWMSASISHEPVNHELFGGMLVHDMFSIYMTVFLLAFAMATVVLTMLTGMPDTEDSADFTTLLLGSVVGMTLMASANTILMIFLAVEMASIPSYAMAGFLKARRASSEAALKFVVFGGASAGVMLYGLSLLAGMYGTIHLPTLAHEMLYQMTVTEEAFNPTLLLALVCFVVGIGFKLSAFPFHFWCPDVFEGAPAEVAGFLSVASKAAAIALLARFSLTLVGTYHHAPFEPEVWQAAIHAVGNYLSPVLAVMGAVTCTFGNLAAFGQTNVKRLLAYSTIAHAGYMMLALATLTVVGAKAVLFYLIVYFFMNLGAFAVVAFVRNVSGSEDLDAFSGLIHRAPVVTVAMSVFLLSLMGLPPLAGFVGKFQIFAVLYETGWYSLLVIGGLNTVISLFYYVNLMRVMIMTDAPDQAPIISLPNAGFATILAAIVIYLGILWNAPEQWSQIASTSLTRPERAVTHMEAPAADLVVEASPDKTGN
ncbi:NADH-quinone oxidoreductase subunit N [Planctomycetes bacterium Pan216]|uniref:NADH-quinone oxidoreductase subunit N n=1 Tax=Kolteria novifilia TaxID=2527975 RepID=A0A518B184_9BACT|nr:NADH-quinone oxidoreductase subunit N [Planctomycetes bacterium Pan216]